MYHLYRLGLPREWFAPAAADAPDGLWSVSYVVAVPHDRYRDRSAREADVVEALLRQARLRVWQRYAALGRVAREESFVQGHRHARESSVIGAVVAEPLVAPLSLEIAPHAPALVVSVIGQGIERMTWDDFRAAILGIDV